MNFLSTTTSMGFSPEFFLFKIFDELDVYVDMDVLNVRVY
jgi:hypothetical protein